MSKGLNNMIKSPILKANSNTDAIGSVFRIVKIKPKECKLPVPTVGDMPGTKPQARRGQMAAACTKKTHSNATFTISFLIFKLSGRNVVSSCQKIDISKMQMEANWTRCMG
eukprot:GHVT01076414.1.p2 GENE.GHVT01076414.1~~GHVT01076414.1.p2  ORF type:complete len:111 (+),score=5.61 GHVT01076414.1:460-792(+)